MGIWGYTSHTMASLYCGDFNMIYREQDKNEGALLRNWMQRFRWVIDDLQLAELHLHGRLYTWSNERRRPTLKRLDRFLALADWLDAFSNHYLASLLTGCSDHTPLSLRLNATPWAKPQFRFESFWTSMEGFLDIVASSWSIGMHNADACRVLDFKLRNTAKALRAWSAKSIGSVRSQLTMARLNVGELDITQEGRMLSADEFDCVGNSNAQSLA